MMKCLSHFLLALVLLVGISACSKAPTWQEQYDLGVRYLSDGNYEESIIAFTAAIEIDPKQAPSYVGRGDAYSGMAQILAEGSEYAVMLVETTARYESAIADYLAALDLDGSVPEVYRKTAEAYVALGNMDAALGILKQGIEVTKDEQLYAYLNELTQAEPLFVLIREDTYGKGPSIPNHADFVYNHADFAYDEQGFQVGLDIWSVYADGSEDCWHSAAWTYDEKSGKWQEEVIRGTGTETKTLNERKPGTQSYISGENFAGGYVHEDPFNSNIPVEGYTASYTYDEHGNAIRIDTYAPDGSLSGWCYLTWEKLSAVS